MKKSAVETIEHATYGAAVEALRKLGYSGVALERAATVITDAVTQAARDTIRDDDACSYCGGEGRIAAYGCGDQAGGYADTCQECKGTGRAA